MCALPFLLAISMLSGDVLINLVIKIVVVATVFWLISWAIGYIGVAEPFNKVLRVILAIAAVLYLASLLMELRSA